MSIRLHGSVQFARILRFYSARNIWMITAAVSLLMYPVSDGKRIARILRSAVTDHACHPAAIALLPRSLGQGNGCGQAEESGGIGGGGVRLR